MRPGGRFLATFLAALLLGGAGVRVAADEGEDEERASIFAEAAQARAGIVRVRWSHPKSRHSHDRCAIVVRPNGWLLMAGPVPPDGSRHVVTLHDGSTVAARVAGRDAESALTVLWINVANELHALPLRAADAIERPAGVSTEGATAGAGGDEHADGAPERLLPVPTVPATLPLGLRVHMVTPEGEVASGVVSTLDGTRYFGSLDGGRVLVTGLVEGMLAAAAGDLGAPWLDDDGRVAALVVDTHPPIAAQISEHEARAHGLTLRPPPSRAWALPAPTIRVVLSLLSKHPDGVPRGVMGVATRPAGGAVRSQLCRGCGAHVVETVDPEGPADRAGLRPQDIILRVGGHELRPGSRLRDALLPYRPDEPVPLLVLRGQDRVTITPTLERRDD